MTDTENLSKYCGIRKSYLQNITNVWKTLENELRNISLNNQPPSSAASEKGNFSVASNPPKFKLPEAKI